jgi:outer membrane protein assembly factor BamB
MEGQVRFCKQSLGVISLLSFMAMPMMVFGAGKDVAKEYPWGWAYQTDKEIFSVPAIDKNIYFGNSKGNMFCLTKKDGKVKWKVTADYRIDSNPLLYKDKVYFAGISNRLHCLKASSGKQVWVKQIPGCGYNDPYLYGDKILIAGKESLTALTSKTGKVLFTVKIKGEGKALTVKDDLCYVISVWDDDFDYGKGKGALNCIDLKKKKVLWSQPLGGNCDGVIRVDDKRCYLGCKDGGFYALKRKDGSVDWKIDCNPFAKSERKDLPEEFAKTIRVCTDRASIIGPEKVYFSAVNQMISWAGVIICADKNNGKLLWKVKHKENFCGQFIIKNGKIIAVTQDRLIYMIDLKDGTHKTSTLLPKNKRGEFAGVAKGDDAIYIVGGDKTIYRVLDKALDKK